MNSFEKISQSVSGLNLSPEQIINLVGSQLQIFNEAKRDTAKGEEEICYFIRIEMDDEKKNMDFIRYEVAVKTINAMPTLVRIIRRKSMKEEIFKIIEALKDPENPDVDSIMKLVLGDAINVEMMIEQVKKNGISGI